jgi:predicted metalloprotease
MRFLAAFAVLVMVVAACGGDDGGGGVFDDAQGDSSTTTPGGDDEGGEGNVDLDDSDISEPIEPLRSIADEEQVAEGADAVMIAAAIDVGAFWEQTYPELYGEELPPLQGGFWSYGPDTPAEELPTCDGALSYEQIQVNAFYCPVDDLIAWDREGLVEPFIDSYGAFTAAVVMAHEYGHAVQARSGDNGVLEQVVLELQADCFAGAWTAYVVEENSDVFQATIDELDVAVGGLLAIRDAPGSSPDDPSAHGSGFDRVSAYSDGLFEGAARCAEYGEFPPIVTQEVFQTEADAASGGNLPAEELLPLLYADLEDYYTQLFASGGLTWVPVNDIIFFDPEVDDPTCGGQTYDGEDVANRAFYCIDDSLVYVDVANHLPRLNEVGDFAIASEIARQWAFSAQAQLGNLDDNLGTNLHADCLAGLYAGDVYFQLRPDTASLVLSPGDLDESIIGFLITAPDNDASYTGTPFERSDAFRTGFIGSTEDCDPYLELS